MEQEELRCSYGFFSQDGREFTITDPRTPRPWVNVISNGDYAMVVSQAGGGYSWRGNAGQNRITRAFQDLVKDNWGKWVYIRDKNAGTFWSAAWKPVMTEPEEFEVVHGFGYSLFRQKVHGIESELTWFVAPEDPVEILVLKLQNHRDSPANLDVTTWFEWLLGHAPDEHREFHKLFIDTRFDPEARAFFVEKLISGFPDEKGRHNNSSWEYVAFHGASQDVSSYDADKESFLGMYNDERDPDAMHREQLAQNTGRFGDAGAALRVDVELAAKGEEESTSTVVFTIGAAKKGKEDPGQLVNRYTSVEGAEEALRGVHRFWSGFLDAEKIRTPDRAMDIMVNGWLKYQAISGRIFAKSGYYQNSAGYGFRDQLQDSLVFLSSDPGRTREQILLHAAHQFQEGDVLHWWLTMGEWGPRTKCSDDLLWLPFIALAYTEETGDHTLWDEKVRFVDGGQATLYEHCKRAVEKAFSRFSPRGIPLMGDNDWNDGLSAVGNDWKGESFWVAQFLFLVLGQWTPVCARRGDIRFAEKCLDVRDDLRQALNRHGWDGEWYLQATTDDGEKVGSHENEEGKIFLNPQIWALISEIAPDARAHKAMACVEKFLLKQHGPLLLSPAYTRPRTDIGYITRYAPGLRENGGVYTHAATWAVWAFALLGNGEKAYECFRKICPAHRLGDIDDYLAEPYVTAGNSDGPESPHFGRGGWSWYTGSAQWLHRVATHFLLGVRPEGDGLRVDPCIPAAWSGFGFERSFRGTRFVFQVENPEHVSRGVAEMFLDGERYTQELFFPIPDGKTHHVKVIMGE